MKIKYRPEGYSWLGVAPETAKGKKIEKLEERIHKLRKKYLKSGDESLASEIHSLEQKLISFNAENKNQ